MQEARDKITGLIRHAVEDQAHLELVTSEGKRTPRGGYPTCYLYAQRGTATVMTIEARWYSTAAAFDLYGPAVDDPADDSLWASRDLCRIQEQVDQGRQQIHILVPYNNEGQLGKLLWLVPALLDRIPEPWVVKDNISGAAASQAFPGKELAALLCSRMNLDAGPGGRYGVRPATAEEAAG